MRSQNHRVPVASHIPENGFAAVSAVLVRDRPLSMASKRRTDSQLPRGPACSARSAVGLQDRLVKRQHCNFVLARVPKVHPPHVARIRRGRGHVVKVVHRRCLTKNNHARLAPRSSIEPGPSKFRIAPPRARGALVSEKRKLTRLRRSIRNICKNRCLIRRTRIRSSASNKLAGFAELYWQRQRMHVK